jgi:hypothetical protein
MAFNIQEIRSQLQLDGARPALFQVRLTNPINSTADIKVPFMVKAASLPDWNMGVVEVGYFGRKIKVAGDRTFSEWNITVINDEDFQIRNALEQWNNSLNLLQGNYRGLASASPTLYKSTAQVIQYGKTMEPIREYTFNGVWPSNIAPIRVDWDAQNQIEEFDVTLQYDWYNVTSTITGDAGGQ